MKSTFRDLRQETTSFHTSRYEHGVEDPLSREEHRLLLKDLETPEEQPRESSRLLNVHMEHKLVQLPTKRMKEKWTRMTVWDHCLTMQGMGVLRIARSWRRGSDGS
jgi:hypothetical protein